MTSADIETILTVEDLVQLGMRADAARQQHHPHPVVSYCDAATGQPDRSRSIDFPEELSADDLQHLLGQVREANPIAVRPTYRPGITGAEYLRLVALCRLYFSEVQHVEVSPAVVGFKLAQLALRFGANDLGQLSRDADEEQVRALVRDAGFIPKRRNAEYTVLFLQ